jgi:uncharacterized protein (TIGR03437 family)
VADVAHARPSGLTPGSLIAIRGLDIGPARVDRALAYPLPLELGGRRVRIGEHWAPLLSASREEIRAIVPDLAAVTDDEVEVVIESTAGERLFAARQARRPQLGLFTAPGAGIGAAAALPAAPSIVSLFGTGFTLAPGQRIGEAVTEAAPSPVLVQAFCLAPGAGVIPADVLYAGSAPGLPVGVTQVNVRLPQNLPSGLLPLWLTQGGARSQSGVHVVIPAVAP